MYQVNIMSESEEEEILFLQPMVLFKMKKKKKKKKKRKKKWVRELFCKWEEKGGFNILMQQMKLADRESFFR